MASISASGLNSILSTVKSLYLEFSKKLGSSNSRWRRPFFSQNIILVWNLSSILCLSTPAMRMEFYCQHTGPCKADMGFSLTDCTHIPSASDRAALLKTFNCSWSLINDFRPFPTIAKLVTKNFASFSNKYKPPAVYLSLPHHHL